MYSSVLFLHIDLYLLGVIEFFMEVETKIIELWIVDAICYHTIQGDEEDSQLWDQ